jgi:hypothetical protein
MHSAIESGNYEAVMMLEELGADLRLVDKWEQNYWFYFGNKFDIRIAELLEANHVFPTQLSYFKVTAMWRAISDENLELIKYLEKKYGLFFSVHDEYLIRSIISMHDTTVYKYVFRRLPKFDRTSYMTLINENYLIPEIGINFINRHMLPLLIEDGLDIDNVDAVGRNALYYCFDDYITFTKVYELLSHSERTESNLTDLIRWKLNIATEVRSVGSSGGELIGGIQYDLLGISQDLASIAFLVKQLNAKSSHAGSRLLEDLSKPINRSAIDIINCMVAQYD